MRSYNYWIFSYFSRHSSIRKKWEISFTLLPYLSPPPCDRAKDSQQLGVREGIRTSRVMVKINPSAAHHFADRPLWLQKNVLKDFWAEMTNVNLLLSYKLRRLSLWELFLYFQWAYLLKHMNIYSMADTKSQCINPPSAFNANWAEAN